LLRAYFSKNALRGTCASGAAARPAALPTPQPALAYTPRKGPGPIVRMNLENQQKNLNRIANRCGCDRVLGLVMERYGEPQGLYGRAYYMVVLMPEVVWRGGALLLGHQYGLTLRLFRPTAG
jgi:hypothetical protein